VQLIGERLSIGALATWSQSPTLRAYVTEALGARNRIAGTIADDEYTYDYSRFAGLINFRAPLDLDVSGDIGYETRHYGAPSTATGPRGKKAPPPTGSNRDENSTTLNLYVSKTIPFLDRLVGIFNGLYLELSLTHLNTVSN